MRVFNFRSRDKHGGQSPHSIRHSRKLHVHANVTAISSTEPVLLPIEVLHCVNSECRAVCYCDLDLDPMTFMRELDPYHLKISRRPKMNLLRQCFRKLSLHTYNTCTFRQTDRQMPPRTLPRHFTGDNF